MSLIQHWDCNICHETIADPFEGGYGIIFHSVKSGDFTLGTCRQTDGTHICEPCAETLSRILIGVGKKGD